MTTRNKLAKLCSKILNFITTQSVSIPLLAGYVLRNLKLRTYKVFFLRPFSLDRSTNRMLRIV